MILEGLDRAAQSARAAIDPIVRAVEQKLAESPSDVGLEDVAVVSFHTVPEHELIEGRPALDGGEQARQRRYSDAT